MYRVWNRFQISIDYNITQMNINFNWKRFQFRIFCTSYNFMLPILYNIPKLHFPRCEDPGFPI